MNNAFPVILAAAASIQSSANHAHPDAQSSFAQWEHRLRDRVNADFAYPIAASPASGNVFVAFRVGPDGKPSGVSIERSSGNAIFDRAAVSLISHLGRIGTIPSGARNVDQVVLKLSYGDGADTASGAIQVAKSDRREQLANERRNQALMSAAARIADNH